MKTKTFLSLTVGIAAIAAAAIVTASSVNERSTQSDLLSKNLEALTQGEGGGNHQNGPGDEVKCKGIFSGHKKICLAFLDTDCVESDCY